MLLIQPIQESLVKHNTSIERNVIHLVALRIDTYTLLRSLQALQRTIDYITAYSGWDDGRRLTQSLNQF